MRSRIFAGPRGHLHVLCWIAVLLAACGDPQGPDGSQNGASGRQAKGSQSAAERPVVAEMLAYAEVDKQLIKGHFAFPANMVEPLPAIILIHEWRGLNDSAKALADKLAAEGFIVLAVDLYNGTTAANAADARNLMIQVVQNPQFAEENIVQAADWLGDTTGAPSIATVGYGFGGDWSLHAAVTMSDRLGAAVMYYGKVSSSEQSLAEIQAPLLGFFAGKDTTIPRKSVAAFETALENLGKTYTIELYDGASDGFADPESRRYDADLAAHCWAQMVEFLHQNLRQSQVE